MVNSEVTVYRFVYPYYRKWIHKGKGLKTRPRVKTSTEAVPPASKARVTADTVALVLSTPSISKIRFPVTAPGCLARSWKAPLTLRLRADGLSRPCAGVRRFRINKSEIAGTPLRLLNDCPNKAA